MEDLLTNPHDEAIRSVADPLVQDDRARLQLLEMSAAAAGIGTFDWDLSKGILKWDNALKQLFGYATDAFNDSISGFNDRLHPDDLARVTSELQEAIATKGEFRSEYRVLLPGGEQRWFGARGQVVCNDDGVAVRLLGAAWDNTAEATRKEMAERSLESMATPYFSLDNNWNFSYANSAAERVLAMTRDQLLGKSIWELFPDALGSPFEANYRRTMTTGLPTAFDAFYPDPLNLWFEVRAWRNDDGIAVYFLDITARVSADSEAEASSRRAHLTSRITEELSGTRNSEESARHLANLVTPELADWCIVNLIIDEAQTGARRGLRYSASKHGDPTLEDTLRRYAEQRLSKMKNDDLIVLAMETGKVQRIDTDASNSVVAMLEGDSLQALMKKLAPESVLVVPLMGPTGPVGMLSLANGSERGAFSPADIVTAEHVGARAGLVLENARLYRQQRTLAEGLQRSLLTPPAEPDDLEVAVRYIAASQTLQVGGDWYDSFVQPGGAATLVIGDVIGHDSVAAATMGQLRSIVRTLGAVGDDSPAQILSRTDDVIETLLVNTTATAIVARLEQTDSERSEGITRLCWSNAGHPPPVVVSADGSVQILDDHKPELLLGADSSFARSEQVLKLERGAIVLFYTDGLIERRGQSIEDGLVALRDALSECSTDDLESMTDQLLAKLLPEESEDDVAVLAVKLHPQD